MNIWETLGIDETSDKKQIKRAYAAKLKRTKPDQDPAGFEKLRHAYETANYQADFSKQHLDDETLEIDSTEFKDLAVSSDDEQAQVLDEFEYDELEDWDDEPYELDPKVQALLDRVSNLLKDTNKRKEASYWQAILEDDLMMDLSFRQEISSEIFALLLEQQKKEFAASTYFQLFSPPILSMLNLEFEWNDNRHLQWFHSAEDYFLIVPRPKKDMRVEPDQKSPFFYRVGANLIDAIIVFLPVFLSLKIFADIDDIMIGRLIEQPYFYLPFWTGMFVYSAIFEFSAKRATLGKQLLSLYVNTSPRRWESYWQLSVRLVLKYFTLCVWALVFQNPISYPGVTAAAWFLPAFAYMHLVSAKVFRKNF